MNQQAIEDSLFIKELIRGVHQELVESRDERLRAGDDPIFEVEKLTLDVHFVITRTDEGKGRVDFKLVTVGGGKKYEQQQLHKITLELSGVPQPAGSELLRRLDTEKPKLQPRRDV